MKAPLHYQISEYDCGPTSLLNALNFLFEREEIPAEIVRNVMLYCLDCHGPDGITGKRGTSRSAVMFLSSWLNEFGQYGQLPISTTYLCGIDVNFRQESLVRDALCRGGAVVLRLDLEGDHYVLLTGMDGERVKLFDPYYSDRVFWEEPIEMTLDEPFHYNRIVPVDCLEREEIIGHYAMGQIERREALLLFNEATKLTPEATIEYFI